MEAIAAELRALRIAAGLSQRQLAKKIGCTHVFICRIENGVSPVPAPRVGQIRRAVRDAAKRSAA